MAIAVAVAMAMAMAMAMAVAVAMASSFLRFPDHTQRHITVPTTPPDERSSRHRNLYLPTHNTQNKDSCLQRDLSPQTQQASGRRSTP
jgi:hypothetical protein